MEEDRSPHPLNAVCHTHSLLCALPTHCCVPHPLSVVCPAHPSHPTHWLRQCDLSVLEHVVDVSIDLLPGDQEAFVAGVQGQLRHQVALDELCDVLRYLINESVAWGGMCMCETRSVC